MINNKRIEAALANGKTVYLRGGKKLRGVKIKAGDSASPAVPSVKTATKKDDKDK